MKTEIIRRLKSSNGYLSSQEICDSFQVSRTAVWKVMNQLREEGYQIESVPRRGYRLIEAADVLTAAECRSRLAHCWFGNTVECFDETDSTNIRAKHLAERGAPEGTLVTAESQTNGKGRRGRHWVSPPGEGLWFSLILRPKIGPYDASMLTLVAALAVAAGIEDVCGFPVQIKWPNDIVVSGKKVVGILTELSAEAEEIHYVIVGIGINVNISEFPDEISKTATSLYLESGRRWKRCDLIVAIMRRMEEYYGTYLKTSDLSVLREEYTKRLVNLGREVRVLGPSDEHVGMCEGIDNRGELLVRRNGELETIMSGEVSVQGVYGYV